MTEENRRIVLATRPEGRVTPDCFRLETAPVPEPGEGELLLRARYLSLDPYMRGRMSDAASYAEPVALGAVMCGATVCEVVLVVLRTIPVVSTPVVASSSMICCPRASDPTRPLTRTRTPSVARSMPVFAAQPPDW